MPLSAAQDAPLGATVMQDGRSFKVWAPRAEAVHVAVAPPGAPALANFTAGNSNLLAKDGAYWSGFVRGVADGWQYR